MRVIRANERMENGGRRRRAATLDATRERIDPSGCALSRSEMQPAGPGRYIGREAC